MKLTTSILAAIILASILAGASAPLLNDPLQNEPPSGKGDWIVDTDTAIRNRTILLTGNLTVESSGSLLLDNVTLLMNVSDNGEYRIKVYGRLDITDGSVITSYDRVHRYDFQYGSASGTVYAKGSIKDSIVEYCGYNGGTYGPTITNAYVAITNSTFRYNYVGLRVLDSNSPIRGSFFLKNDNIGLYVYHHCGIIEENTVENNGGDNSTDGTVPLGDEGLLSWYSSSTIKNNIFRNNTGESSGTSNMVVIENDGSPVTVENNIFDGGIFGMVVMKSELFIRNNSFSNMEKSGIGLAVSKNFGGAEYATITNNTFHDNLVGIAISKAEDDCTDTWHYANISDNLFYHDDGDFAVYGPNRTYMVVDNLTLRDNIMRDSGAGIVFLWGKTNESYRSDISHNTGSGMRIAIALNHSNLQMHDNDLRGGNMSYQLPSWVENLVGPDVRGDIWADNSSIVSSTDDIFRSLALRDNSTLYVRGNLSVSGRCNITEGSTFVPMDNVSIRGPFNLTDSKILPSGKGNRTYLNISGVFNMNDSYIGPPASPPYNLSAYVLLIGRDAHGRIYNSTIEGAGQSNSYAIPGFIVRSDNVSISSSNMSHNYIGILSEANITVDNSTIYRALGVDAQSTEDLHLLNCSFDTDRLNPCCGGSISADWFLNVQVNDTDGNPVSGAYVRIEDNGNGTSRITGHTDANGTLSWNVVTEFVDNESGRTYLTPYMVSATIPGSGDSKSVSVSRSMWVYLTLHTIAPPTNFTATVSNSDIRLTWTDSQNADHYEIHRSTERGTTGPIIANVTQGTQEYYDTSVVGDGNDYYYSIISVSSSGAQSNSTYQVMKHDQALTEGLNLISLTSQPFSGMTAYSILNNQTDEIPGCVKVMQWNTTSGSWDSAYLFGSTPQGTNFNVTVGAGYFVKVSADTIWTTTGRVLTSPVQLHLKTGLNLVSIPYSTTQYTSYDILNNQTNEIPGCVKVMQWNTTSGSWDSAYLFGSTPKGTNFSLLPGHAYFIKVTADVDWTPSSDSQGNEPLHSVGVDDLSHDPPANRGITDIHADPIGNDRLEAGKS